MTEREIRKRARAFVSHLRDENAKVERRGGPIIPPARYTELEETIVQTAMGLASLPYRKQAQEK